MPSVCATVNNEYNILYRFEATRKKQIVKLLSIVFGDTSLPTELLGGEVKIYRILHHCRRHFTLLMKLKLYQTRLQARLNNLFVNDRYQMFFEKYDSSKKKEISQCFKCRELMVVVLQLATY